MRVKGLIAQKKTTTQVRRGKKEELRKRVKTLCSYFSTGSCTCVFYAVIFKPSLFYEPFFVRQHAFIMYSWEFRCGCFFYLSIIFHWSCVLIEVEYTRHTFKLSKVIGSLSLSFLFLFSFFLSIQM